VVALKSSNLKPETTKDYENKPNILLSLHVSKSIQTFSFGVVLNEMESLLLFSRLLKYLG
jgi:hypothetical protein